MADRGLCSVCGGDFAVAQDGTPYKHGNNDAEVCPGSDSPISMLLADAVWLVYANEGNFVVHGPVNKNEDHPQAYNTDPLRGTGASLPLVGTVPEPTPENVNPLLPGDQAMPTGEPTTDPEPAPAGEEDPSPPQDQEPAQAADEPAAEEPAAETPKKRTSRKRT